MFKKGLGGLLKRDATLLEVLLHNDFHKFCQNDSDKEKIFAYLLRNPGTSFELLDLVCELSDQRYHRTRRWRLGAIDRDETPDATLLALTDETKDPDFVQDATMSVKVVYAPVHGGKCVVRNISVHGGMSVAELQSRAAALFDLQITAKDGLMIDEVGWLDPTAMLDSLNLKAETAIKFVRAGKRIKVKAASSKTAQDFIVDSNIPVGITMEEICRKCNVKNYKDCILQLQASGSTLSMERSFAEQGVHATDLLILVKLRKQQRNMSVPTSVLHYGKAWHGWVDKPEPSGKGNKKKEGWRKWWAVYNTEEDGAQKKGTLRLAASEKETDHFLTIDGITIVIVDQFEKHKDRVILSVHTTKSIERLAVDSLQTAGVWSDSINSAVSDLVFGLLKAGPLSMVDGRSIDTEPQACWCKATSRTFRVFLPQERTPRHSLFGSRIAYAINVEDMVVTEVKGNPTSFTVKVHGTELKFTASSSAECALWTGTLVKANKARTQYLRLRSAATNLFNVAAEQVCSILVRDSDERGRDYLYKLLDVVNTPVRLDDARAKHFGIAMGILCTYQPAHMMKLAVESRNGADPRTFFRNLVAHIDDDCSIADTLKYLIQYSPGPAWLVKMGVVAGLLGNLHMGANSNDVTVRARLDGILSTIFGPKALDELAAFRLEEVTYEVHTGDAIGTSELSDDDSGHASQGDVAGAECPDATDCSREQAPSVVSENVDGVNDSRPSPDATTKFGEETDGETGKVEQDGNAERKEQGEMDEGAPGKAERTKRDEESAVGSPRIRITESVLPEEDNHLEDSLHGTASSLSLPRAAPGDIDEKANAFSEPSTVSTDVAPPSPRISRQTVTLGLDWEKLRPPDWSALLGKQAIASHSRKAQQPNEMSIQEGELVVLDTTLTSLAGWFVAKKGGTVALLPEDIVHVLDDSVDSMNRSGTVASLLYLLELTDGLDMTCELKQRLLSPSVVRVTLASLLLGIESVYAEVVPLMNAILDVLTHNLPADTTEALSLFPCFADILVAVKPILLLLTDPPEVTRPRAWKLSVVSLLRKLICLHHTEMDEVLQREGVVGALLDFFFANVWASAIHDAACHAICDCLEGGSDSLLSHMIFEVNMPGRILEAYKANALSEERDHLRLGYMGHLFVMVRAMNRNERVQVTLENNTEWTDFLEGEFAETEQRNATTSMTMAPRGIHSFGAQHLREIDL